MHNLFLITLLLLSSTSSMAIMFEKKIDVGIKNLSIISDEFNLVGTAEINRLTFSSAFVNVSLRDKNPRVYSININPESINLIGGDFNYMFPSSPNLDGINYKKILSTNFNFKLYNNILELKSDYFELETINYYLKASMFGIECFLENNEVDIERCINNSKISSFTPDSYPTLSFKNATSQLNVSARTIIMTPEQFKIDANSLVYDTDDFNMSLKNSILSCNKGWFTSQTQGDHLISGCLLNGQLHEGELQMMVPKQNLKATISNNQMLINDYNFDFNLKSSNIEMKENTTFSTEKSTFKCKAITRMESLETFDFKKMLMECAAELSSDVENLHYKSNDFSVKMNTFHYETDVEDLTRIYAQINGITGGKENSSFSIPSVKASCNSIKSFDLSELITDCLMDGTIDLPNVSFSDHETKTDVSINISSANIKNNQFILNAPKITITSPTISADIQNVEASCKRNQDDDPLDFELLQRRCFENSLLKIPLINATNNKYSLGIEIKDISVDKNQLFLNIPKANYDLDDKNIDFKEMSFHCNPNVTFEHLRDLNTSNIIDNCVNNTKIAINTLVSKLKNGGKKTKYENVSFVTANSNFNLQLKMSVMFIPTNVKFSGTISFNKETNEIILNVLKASAGPLLGKDTILFFMKNFFSDESIRVSGNQIIMKL